jgi:hypothetical protein
LRKLVLAAGGIVLVGGAAIAVILFTGGDVSAPDLSPVVVAGAPAPLNIPIGPITVIGPDGGIFHPVEPSPPAEFEPPPPPPPDDSWEAVRVAGRPGSLGALGRIMMAELVELQPRLSLCFDEEAQSRFGQVPVSRALVGGQEADPNGPTVLFLNLDLQSGQIRIADAPVQSQGGASDGLVACAQRVLRGHVIPTAAAQQAGRARMMFQLHQ